MSLVLIRSALETALATITPSLSTAYENTSFTPVVGTPYQAVYLLPSDPEDLEMTGSLFWERGIFQINHFYPLQEGTAPAFTRAGLVQDTFRRGASFTSGAVTVTIRDTPAIGQAFTDDDRYVVPVRIRYSARIIRS